MTRYVAIHVLTGLAMLLATSVLVFAALRVIPGDPTSSLALSGATEEQVAALKEELGLNRSVPVQYLEWVSNAVRGDLGVSYFSQFPTTELIKDRLSATVILTCASLAIAIVIALVLGAFGAVYDGRWIDRGVAGLASAGVAFPPFWLGIIMLAVFSVQLGWLPSRGYVSFVNHPVDAVRHLILPAVTLSIILAAPILRFFRSAIFEVTASDFIRTARSKGLPERTVVLRHVLPNAAVPTVGYIGLITGHLLGGVVIIEYVFGWPGLGSLAVSAVTQRDYAVLQGVVMFGAAVFIAVTILTDVVMLAIDPRLRPGHAR